MAQHVRNVFAALAMAALVFLFMAALAPFGPDIMAALAALI
jgi:hypothetical protein